MANRDNQQPESTPGAEGVTATQPGFVLLLACLAESVESKSVVSVLELLAVLFAGQGTAAGSEQPPAFVAGDVAR